MTTTTPNILWIQTDEQRPDSLGCYGSSWAKTPNLDELAARGVTFRRAFCQSPICVPSRTSQMTCRYPQELGVLNNPIDAYNGKVYPDDTVMFTELLAAAGYETVTFGKRHIAKRPTSWHRHESCQVDPKYAGFFELGPGYADADYRVIKRPGSSPIILAGTYPGSLTDNPSRRITDWAIDYLRARDRATPFMLRVSHNYPHTPVLPPKPFDRLYVPDELPIRYFDQEAYACRSAADRAMADSHKMRELSRDQVRQMWCDYMGLCGYVDHEVGRLLAALRALGLEENTVIVYSSDHGKMLGEWGAGEKGCFDDPVWRVPMIWSWPGHLPDGEKRHDLCELLDMGKTLLGLTGLADRTPTSWRGRDLFDPSAKRPEFLVGQIGIPNKNSVLALATEPGAGTPRYNPRPLHMAIRTDRYRLDLPSMRDGRRIPDADGNLFDLEADPQERINLWSDPRHAGLRADLLAKLEGWFNAIPQHPGLFLDAPAP